MGDRFRPAGASRKLTGAEIRRAKPGEKPIKLWDGEGLHLYVPTSVAKLWRLKYRIGGAINRF